MTTRQDELRATAVETMLCSCHEKPLGLDFVLTAGCLVHDHCVCHEAEHMPGDDACQWCDSYVALLKALGSLDEATRQHVKLAYLDAR